MGLKPVLASTHVTGRRGQFSIGIKLWTDKVEKRLNRILQKIEYNMLVQVVYLSPVKTGLFRGNWQVMINTVWPGTIAKTDKNGSRTIAAGNKVIKTKDPGDITYIINNLPYARRLEYGWSKQAPGGMVRIVSAQFKAVVAQSIAEAEAD